MDDYRLPFQREACYQALLTHDTRFDGVLFVGVSTTGIYCRTVCRARTPRPQHCTFFPSAAAAERAGYRACRRCRPEWAPGRAPVDGPDRLAALAVARIEEGALWECSVEALAEELGISGRHLRRILLHYAGVTPLELAQRHQLLLARRLLASTRLSVAEVAFASGFSSVRRFNAVFRERCGETPSDGRRTRPPAAASDSVMCEVGYRPPFDWCRMLAFLEARALPGVEAVENGAYARTARIGEHRGWIVVRPVGEQHRLQVEISSGLAPRIPQILGRVRRLFDLDADPALITAQLGELGAGRPGMRVPGAFSGFEMALRAILGQQVSVKAATTFAGRLVTACGEPFPTPVSGLTHLSPGATAVAAAPLDVLRSLGLTAARARSIQTLAQAAAARPGLLRPGPQVEQSLQLLRALPGIGEWTAQYIAMRALSWPDAFPAGDLGVRRALGVRTEREAIAAAAVWRPWRAYATLHLWLSLQEGERLEAPIENCGEEP